MLYNLFIVIFCKLFHLWKIVLFLGYISIVILYSHVSGEHWAFLVKVFIVTKIILPKK